MKYTCVQRVKYLKILEILKKESDEDRPLTTNELIEKLQAKDIVIDRKTLYEDIRILNFTGYEIICNRSQQNEYYVIDRQFNVPELRILMGAVQAASFIPENKTEELLAKIATLSGSYRKQLLLRDNFCFDTNKHNNEQIYFVVNEIEEAIIHNKKIDFKYFDLDYRGRKVFRKDGQKYEVSPVAMLFSNDNYYLVCFSDKYESYSNYRIDRMETVKVLEAERTSSKLIKHFDPNQYRKQSFGMFSGEPQVIVLEFDKSLIDVIFDKFGESTSISKVETAPNNQAKNSIAFANNLNSAKTEENSAKTEENSAKTEERVMWGETYRTRVKVFVSQQFYGFILGLGDKMKITAPEEVVQGLKTYVENIRSLYKEKDI